MAMLNRVRSFDAPVNLYTGKPRLDSYKEALYFPNCDTLYDRHRRAIIQSAYMRNGNGDLLGVTFLAPPNGDKIEFFESDYPIYYIGPLRQHYGHFLLSTFSRLWFLVKEQRPVNFRLLTHGDPAEILERNSYIEEMLSMLGVRKSNLIAFDRPTRLSRVLIPEPSFEEGHYAYAAFRDMGKYCGGLSNGVSDEVVYLTKTGIEKGLSRVENERELIDALNERISLKIFDPSLMSVREQIDALNKAKLLIGCMGSHFHSAIFLRPKPMVIVSNAAAMPANQALIDRISDHQSVYLYSPTLANMGNNGKFETNYRLTDVCDIADQLANIVAILDGDMPPELAPHRGGSLLSRGRSCLQSSLYSSALARTLQDEAKDAAAGFLTGSYQIHTAAETNPWWQVDLGQVSDVNEILVFNRIDAASDRLRCFALSGSLDGIEWTEFFKTEDAPEASYPFRWSTQSSVRARFVRLTLFATDFLHLDQVAVFGRSTG